MSTPDPAKVSRRRFNQFLASAAAIGFIDGPRAASILGRESNRLSWRAHRTAGREGLFELKDIEGELPSELVGTLYRTAPGESERFGVTFNHLFDGDAFLSGYSFRDGKVTLRAQFLDQPRRIEEQKAGEMIYSEFGTKAPKSRGDKNQPSVNVIPWDGRLLGLSEGGHPTAIDAKTLKFEKSWDFHGTLPGGHSFTAHPKIDPDGVGYCYGIAQGRGMALNVYRMEKDGKLIQLHSIPQPGYFMIHDMILSKDHIIFLIPPVSYEVMSMMTGTSTPADAVRYAEENPLRVLVMRKDGEGEPFELEEPAGMVFHHGNAFETEGILTLDTFLSPDGTILRQLKNWAADKMPVESEIQVTRMNIDLESQEVLDQEVFGEQEEFPRYDERRGGSDLRYLYAAGRAPKDDALAMQALVRHDMQEGKEDVLATAANQTVAEPVFVPREIEGAENDGWILQLGYDGERDETYLDVVDGKAFARQARIWTGTHLPLGFHGNFSRDHFVE
ncbi:MAG: carotenoid oxygenase family protein [Planctomycetota bacterium]|jgi:carotenoid cleavage dioxygenase-like enzyme